VIVGIAGGTGSGKTTVAMRVHDGVGLSSSLIQHDWYYRDLSGYSEEARALTNFDHPDSLDTELLIAHLTAMKAGLPIDCPQYDFQHHTRAQEIVRIEPSPVIIVEGILIFSDPRVRALLDLKLYVDTAADIRVFRRIRRDIRERGRDFESIRSQYFSTVRPMHMLYVEPTKAYADLIIPEGGENQVAIDVIIEHLRRFLKKDPTDQV
jgi:uridine kinase